MVITKEMVDEAKKYAWQNENHFMHAQSNINRIDDYPGFFYKKKYIINPWSQYLNDVTLDPFIVYGQATMEMFIIELLSYKDVAQLQNENTPAGWLYIGDEGEGKERFVLGEIGTRNMICFGINPSTAKPGDDDQTIQRVRKIASQYGYDGWIMLNMYPIRWTNPKKLPKEADNYVMKKNEIIVKGILELYPNAPIWAAWGANIDKKKYLRNLLLDNIDVLKNRTWICRGKISKKGHPHHPLYVAAQDEFVQFNYRKYIDEVLS